jgi:hypothetical protein
MAKKEKLFINIEKRVPLVLDTPAPKPQSTDLKKSVRLYIRIK